LVVSAFINSSSGLGCPGTGPALEPKMSSAGLVPWSRRKSSTIYGVIGHLERWVLGKSWYCNIEKLIGRRIKEVQNISLLLF